MDIFTNVNEWEILYLKITTPKNDHLCGAVVSETMEYSVSGDTEWAKFYKNLNLKTIWEDVVDKFKLSLEKFIGVLNQETAGLSDDDWNYVMTCMRSLEDNYGQHKRKTFHSKADLHEKRNKP